MTKNILKSKLTKPLKYKAKLQFSIKDQNDSESSHNPKPTHKKYNIDTQEKKHASILTHIKK